MKTVVIATDFSDNAKHAAEYGYALATQFKADIVLCNAFIVPAEVPDARVGNLAGNGVLEELDKESKDELKGLKDFLLKKGA